MGEGEAGRTRAPSRWLVELIEANARWWAAEAEVFRTYWDWDGRTRATDRAWLARQCHKELFDGFLPRLQALDTTWAGIEQAATRADVLELSKSAYEELAHYCAFAAAYDAIRDDAPPLDVDILRGYGWAENAALADIRARHIRDHGDLGRRAQAFTEGGYCTLFSEGERLRGRGGVDDVIASACALVYGDEWEHMLLGIAGLDDHDRDPAEWRTLRDLSVEQMRARIRMRNAQFGSPLPAERVAAIEAGDVVPLAFDYRRAGFTAPPR